MAEEASWKREQTSSTNHKNIQLICVKLKRKVLQPWQLRTFTYISQIHEISKHLFFPSGQSQLPLHPGWAFGFSHLLGTSAKGTPLKTSTVLNKPTLWLLPSTSPASVCTTPSYTQTHTYTQTQIVRYTQTYKHAHRVRSHTHMHKNTHGQKYT